MNPLLNTSILLHLEIRKWAGEVADKKALQAVAKTFNSDTHLDKYKKSLFVTDALAEIDCCAGRIRNHFYAMSVPWLDGGKGRLIPSMNFQEFAVKHKEFRIDFEKAVTKFIDDYDDLKADAKAKKGDLFNEAEYPPKKALADRFSITLNTLPFPSTEDIRLDAPAEIITELKKNMDESIARVADVVSAQFRTRFQKRLTMLVKTLRVGQRFNKSLLTELDKVIEMANNVKAAVDKKLLKDMQTVTDKVLIHQPTAIRDSQQLQEELIEICEKIL